MARDLSKVALEAAIGGANSKLRDFAEENVVADNDSIFTCVDKLDKEWGKLAAPNDAAKGAALVGFNDTNSSLSSVANVNVAIDELALPLTLTPGAEAADNIDVVVAGPAHVAQYLARVYNENGLQEGGVAGWNASETGAGAEVFGTGTPTLLFTTDAAGAATIRVNDAAGGSNTTVLLVIEPACASAGKKAGVAAAVALTFD